MEKNIIGLIKEKEREQRKKQEKKEKKENSTELQKPNIEAELCNNNKKCE